ncbi:MAG: hypothetical protein IKD66_07320 [Solobacterium sp.]|nr:hypothetical protein [Solobacterium sp.]
MNGGFLYQFGSENGYHIDVIDDKTGETICWYYYFEIDEAEDMARNTNNSTKWISKEELEALRERNRKYTPERSGSGRVI